MTTGFSDYDLLIIGMGPVGAVAANLSAYSLLTVSMW